MDGGLQGAVHLVFSWEEDRKIVLRIWSLIFSILATLMLFSMIEGRMAYVQGPYTGYVRFWTDCKRHKCASLGRVTVLIHMSQGFMILALALCIFLLPCMGLSFWSVFHRLNKIDSVFSSLSISIDPVPNGHISCSTDNVYLGNISPQSWHRLIQEMKCQGLPKKPHKLLQKTWVSAVILVWNR
ncbi:uncharacterized protein LOC104873799 isoform X5 [Fukomys damarensis]|uniref:uncharacterized protein LOC104873799 isoform X5 n=1 Tax=Fukomys damarensis TaxID=885580 RepID=UPI000540167C|nr:uncharacterized protein LOC104873799 isoform X5 [Fukomys damarensis]